MLRANAGTQNKFRYVGRQRSDLHTTPVVYVQLASYSVSPKRTGISKFKIWHKLVM